MQAKVDGMATREPEEALDGGLCPKSKGASQEVINNETENIICGSRELHLELCLKD